MVRRLSEALTHGNELHLDVSREEAIDLISSALLSWEGELASVVGVDERPLGKQLAVYYVVAGRTTDQFLHVRVPISIDDPTFPSLTPSVPAANWGEREVYDMLGLQPLEHPDLRPLVLHDGWPASFHPLRRDSVVATYTSPLGVASPYTLGTKTARKEPYQHQVVSGEGMVQVPVGPIHAGIIEPGHFRFSTTGEKVLHLDARLFYTHRGVEKLVEDVPVEKAISMVEATCGVCSVSHAVAFSRACERLAGSPAPQRAETLRALLLELERLYNHIGDIGNLCAGVGLAFGVQRGAQLKERLMQLNEHLTGHRFLRNVIIPGGLRRDLNLSQVTNIVNAVAADFADLVEQLWDETTLLDRLRNTGKLEPRQARAWGAVGPAARASGVSCDWRIYHPQPGYERLQVQEALRQTTDVEARALVRIDEVTESVRLVNELCDMAGKGSVQVPLGPMQTGRPALGYCESPRGAMVHWLMAGKNNTIYRLHIRSAAFANWPVVPFAVVGNIVPDFPLINKSFELCYACCDR